MQLFKNPVVARVCVLCLVAVINPSDAVSDDVKIDHVSVGFRGKFKVGRWTPITASVSSSSQMSVRLVVECFDSSGNRAEFPSELVTVEDASPTQLTGRFMSGRIDSPIRVRVLDENGAELDSANARETAKDKPQGFVPQVVTSLSQSNYVVVTLGEFEHVNGLDPNARGVNGLGDEFTVVSYPTPNLFPREPGDLDSVDAVIVDCRIAEQLNDHSAVIRQWVADGGHLFVSFGDGVESYLQSALGEWLTGSVRADEKSPKEVKPTEPPVQIADIKLAQLRTLDGLENYARQSSRIAFQGTIPLVKIRPSFGHVPARQFADPLIYRAPYGFGRITAFAISINRPPISNWERLPRILKGLLITAEEEALEAPSGGKARITQTGVSDLSTQMAMARESFEGVDRISTWSVLILLAVYALVVGPLDHLVVGRLLKRPHLTWITAPLLIVTATVLTVSAARSTNTDEMKANCVNIVDYDLATERCRVQSLSTIYSPNGGRHELALTQKAANSMGVDSASSSPMQINIHGVPEMAFGGMYRSSGIQFGSSAYRYSEHLQQIESLPISQSGTVSVQGTHESIVKLPIQSTLHQLYQHQLSGTITHQFPRAISRWIVVYGGQVYYPSRLPVPIKRFVPWTPEGEGIAHRDLEGFLTATRTKVDKKEKGELRETMRNVKGTYDTKSDDLVSIVRMLSFHTAAGGRNYTNLNSDDFRKADFSDLVRLDRAVLFGEIDADMTDLQVDGKPLLPEQRTTLIRIVLPVTPED